MLPQAFPMEVFHDQIGTMGWIDTEVMHDNDVRIGQLTGNPRFALEAGVELRIGAELGIDQFDRDLAFENGIERAIYLGHAAAAQELEQSIPISKENRQLQWR